MPTHPTFLRLRRLFGWYSYVSDQRHISKITQCTTQRATSVHSVIASIAAVTILSFYHSTLAFLPTFKSAQTLNTL